MGLFDRWRSVGDGLSSGGQGLDALAADMTRQGAISQTSVLKRSVEGAGATVLEALLDCRAQALKQRGEGPLL